MHVFRYLLPSRAILYPFGKMMRPSLTSRKHFPSARYWARAGQSLVVCPWSPSNAQIAGLVIGGLFWFPGWTGGLYGLFGELGEFVSRKFARRRSTLVSTPSIGSALGAGGGRIE